MDTSQCCRAVCQSRLSRHHGQQDPWHQAMHAVVEGNELLYSITRFPNKYSTIILFMQQQRTTPG